MTASEAQSPHPRPLSRSGRGEPDLNPAQLEAVRTLSGPLLVLAGAGSGKTRVVTYRIAALIKSGVRPARILAVTFTNKAAREMQERVQARLGRMSERPRISTFHSHCVSILRRQIRRLGYPEKFAIYDRGDQESLARQVLRELRTPSETLRPGDLLHYIGRWKNRSIDPAAAAAGAQTDKEHLAAVGYRRYQRSIKNAGAVDFDDLLLCTEELFSRFPDVRRAEARLFDHLLVDEYQDTNGSQYRIVKALAQDHRNLCVVGDDDQSIYGWRGAEVDHILRFVRDWPGAREVRLEDNYRSTQAILEAAGRLIVFNRRRHDKVLRAARPNGEPPRVVQCKDETAEAVAIVADIQRRLQTPGLSPRDFAILVRTNEQPRPFETELRRVKLPYVLVGGMSFFDRKEVRDVLAYLRVLDNSQDEVSLLRIINTPPRGIGAKAVEALLAAAVKEGRSVWDVLPGCERLAGVTPAAAAGVRSLIAILDEKKLALKQRPLPQVARELIAKVGYEAEIRRQYSDPNEQAARLAAVEEVINSLAAYVKGAKKPSLTEFLDEAALGDRSIDDEKEKQLRRDAVALLTLHSAKGLEFPHVYMVGLEEGILPHHRSVEIDGDAIDEERRLCYVGMTRAQERLTLSLALTRMKWGKPRPTTPSRFLYEITGQAERAPQKRRPAPHKRNPAARSPLPSRERGRG
jgi:DNA helicase-2/ATP-dependent DNA helicase PcrA